MLVTDGRKERAVHELALAQSLWGIIQRAAAPHADRRIERARLRLGMLTHVDPETLTFAFQAVTRGTKAERCELVFERVPVTARCGVCAFVGPSATEPGLCPSCGGAGLTVLTGRELEVVTIDVEDPPDA
ncbi:MAG: hydrogenase maturation nickel metallochaperone HypA [Deltaproteobacteria bacterium]|nr:hydrogenase maturation nickel metallochaperone HypA [Deltaproteobacteria bacterium]